MECELVRQVARHCSQRGELLQRTLTRRDEVLEVRCCASSCNQPAAILQIMASEAHCMLLGRACTHTRTASLDCGVILKTIRV